VEVNTGNQEVDSRLTSAFYVLIRTRSRVLVELSSLVITCDDPPSCPSSPSSVKASLEKLFKRERNLRAGRKNKAGHAGPIAEPSNIDCCSGGRRVHA